MAPLERVLFTVVGTFQVDLDESGALMNDAYSIVSRRLLALRVYLPSQFFLVNRQPDRPPFTAI